MIPMEWDRFGVKSTLQCQAGLCAMRIYNIFLHEILMDLCKVTRQSFTMVAGALGTLQEFHSLELRVSGGQDVGFLSHTEHEQEGPAGRGWKIFIRYPIGFS